MHYQPQRHLLQDRIILVTGASDGIGREAALTYSRYSASVILVGRNEEKLRSVAHEIQQAGGIPARWFTLDLLTCTPQECQQLAFYQERFTLFLQQAQEHARPQLELSHKLGFAAGLAAAILCL